MKIVKLACAAMLATGISFSAQAAVFNITGVMTGVDASFKDFPDYTHDISFNPENPAFTGTWNIDLSALTLSGNADFESYWATTQMTLGDMQGTLLVQRPHDQHVIDTSTANFAYNAATRSLAITQAKMIIGGISANCAATGPLATCDGFDGELQYEDEFTLLLVFNETFTSFTGSSVNTRVFPGMFEASDNTHWSFSGTEVPVPAAAWLFGSGLIGLAGIARRRRNNTLPQ